MTIFEMQDEFFGRKIGQERPTILEIKKSRCRDCCHEWFERFAIEHPKSFTEKTRQLKDSQLSDLLHYILDRVPEQNNLVFASSLHAEKLEAPAEIVLCSRHLQEQIEKLQVKDK